MTKRSTWEQRSKSLEQRFDEKVSKGDGCWPWTSALNVRGYGLFWVGGAKRSEYAHRWAWQRANGWATIREGQVVMHSCDNPACVNPAHLSVGTHKDNQQDAMHKGRKAHGERNRGGRKLTDDSVREIKRLQAEGWGCLRVSAKFGVSAQTAKAIKRGKLWRHIV